MVDVKAPEGEKLTLQRGILFPPGIFLDRTTFYRQFPEWKLWKELERRLHLLQQEKPTSASQEES